MNVQENVREKISDFQNKTLKVISIFKKHFYIYLCGTEGGEHN